MDSADCIEEGLALMDFKSSENEKKLYFFGFLLYLIAVLFSKLEAIWAA
jgi:hypothetical protein